MPIFTHGASSTRCSSRDSWQTGDLDDALPDSAAELVVELAPTEVRAARPFDCVMSIVAPDSKACCDNLRTAFCDHVNLFKDEQAFATWSRGRRDVGCVTLQEAQLFARRRKCVALSDVDFSSLSPRH